MSKLIKTTIALFVTAFIVFSFIHAKNTVPYLSASFLGMEKDSIPNTKNKKTNTISFNDDKQNVEMKLENDEMTSLRIDGKEIPKGNYKDYETLTSKIRHDLPTPPDAPDAPNKKMEKGNKTIHIDNGDNGSSSSSYSYSWSSRDDDEKENAADRLEDLRDQINDLTQEMNDPDNGFTNKSIEKEMRILKEQFEGNKNLSETQLQAAEKSLRQAERELERAQRTMEDKEERNDGSNKSIKKRFSITTNDGSDFSGQLGETLERDGLIKNKDKYSFELSQNTLKVNGSKQPTVIYQKYARLYEDLTGDEINSKTKVAISSKKGDLNVSISTSK